MRCPGCLDWGSALGLSSPKLSGLHVTTSMLLGCTWLPLGHHRLAGTVASNAVRPYLSSTHQGDGITITDLGSRGHMVNEQPLSLHWCIPLVWRHDPGRFSERQLRGGGPGEGRLLRRSRDAEPVALALGSLRTAEEVTPWMQPTPSQRRANRTILHRPVSIRMTMHDPSLRHLKPTMCQFSGSIPSPRCLPTGR